jgi:uncharacterized membrane protein HdeD (DUF308 family)
MLLHLLAKNWWLVLLRGLAAIAFGIVALTWPGITLVALMLVYGIYAVADGVMALIAACAGGTIAPRWWLVLIGLLGLAAGAFTLVYPGITAVLILGILAAWCVVRGIFEIIGAIRLRKEIDNEWMLVVSGILSVIVGAVLLARPITGVFALVWLLGIFGIASGLLLIGFAFRLRKHAGAGMRPSAIG